MYDAMADQRAARATVELVASEPVRDAASDLANALVKGMRATAAGAFLDQVKREQTVLMLCMREDLDNEGSLRRKVGTNPPIAADARAPSSCAALAGIAGLSPRARAVGDSGQARHAGGFRV